MLFNSLTYAFFLPVVFVIYWFYVNKNLQLQNFFLLAVSYVFYAWWDWRFLTLIIFSSAIDYFCGIQLGKTDDPANRKMLLWFSILINIGFLFFFKYFNFFVDSFAELSQAIGFQANKSSLKIILPVGISFYTFQTMSYTIDVYRRKMEPTSDALAFFTYVAFFPQLVAGPIERAINLLPQFFSKRIFTYEAGVQGMRLILWGLFKKVVVADNCAVYVDTVFGSYSDASRVQLLLALVLFAFQIYGDFSGYSDIAKGSARLLGFDLMTNFRTPYFSRDIAEFWRRWHISLSSWFKDYLYIPLGGSKEGKTKAVRNTLIIFLVSGFWHGANWTFLFWGFLHALYFLPLLLSNTHRVHLEFRETKYGLPTLKEFSQMVFTFVLVTFSWLFFRANSMTAAFHYLASIATPARGVRVETVGTTLLIALCFIQVIFEWTFRKEIVPFTNFESSKPLRYAAYLAVGFLIISYGAYVNPQSFIYFQF
jgi:alginate O-acetyltransferase complex protein AlgI